MYMLVEMELGLYGEGKNKLDFTDHSCFKSHDEERGAVCT